MRSDIQSAKHPSGRNRFGLESPLEAAPPTSEMTRANPAKEILLVIVPGYSLLSLGCLAEPLSFARTIPSIEPFMLSVYDLGDESQGVPQGLRVAGVLGHEDLDARILMRPTPEAIFFCCGFDVPVASRETLRRFMRQSRRACIPIYGIGAATWALAEAGLLRGRKGVVHWSSLSAFKERNYDSDPLAKLYHTDHQVSTCAGELATLDLVISFARQTFGKAVMDQICDRFLVSRPRGPEADQPVVHASLLRYAPRIVRDTVDKMSQNIETPLSISDLATAADVSPRQLERLFGEYLGSSPRKFYCDLQLGLAWQLCEQTDLAVAEIAIASGFTSHAALSRKFKSRYGISPTEMRCRARSAVRIVD